MQSLVKGLLGGPLFVNDHDRDGNASDRNLLNDDGRFLLIVLMEKEDLFTKLCSYENLELAFKKARKGKTLKPYVLEFEENLEQNLLMLRLELLLHAYRPQSLKTFILRDPKTRKISVSSFRDRVVHHALVQIIEPIFEKSFIYDSYANRLGKGTLAALNRFDHFKHKVSRNNTKHCFVLKADIKHYFETVNHNILLKLIRREVNNAKVIRLIKQILKNYAGKEANKGMPLGNYTSQFFANVYLHELDWFVKHQLKAKYYLRYVDDFLILHRNRKILEEYKEKINVFLREQLSLELHPDKSKILLLAKAIPLLGYREFYHCRLLRKRNFRKIKDLAINLLEEYSAGAVTGRDIKEIISGWLGYLKEADTHHLKNNLLTAFHNSGISFKINKYTYK